ncbi:hypothetical protein LUZ60_009384 [Juncus effusus]|nr:hypothetical protein LUZ60_009384 [Juncus effusus]
MQPGSSGQGPPGFDPIRQQNLAFRQGMQQQQQDQPHQQQPQPQPQQLNFQPGSHPMLNSNTNNLPNFPTSASSSSGPQMQMRIQNPQAQPQNPVHQAYFQFALQQQQQMQQQQQQQQNPHANILAQQTGNPSGNPNPNLKMHDLMSLQRNNAPNNPFMARPSQPQPGNPNPNPNPNQQMMNQYQMMQEWAKQQNLDLSVPANMNLLAQVFHSRMAGQPQKNPNPNPNESSTANQHQQMQQAQQHMVPSPSGGSEGSASASHGTINTNPLSEISGQRPPVGQLGQAGSGSNNNINSAVGSDAMSVQYMRQQEQNQQGRTPAVGSAVNASGGETGAKQSNFTKQQLHVLKAQILAFRRLKRGDRTLPAEVLEAIMAPPLDPTHTQPHPPTAPQPQMPPQASNPPAQPHTPQTNRPERIEQQVNNATQQIPTNEKAPIHTKPHSVPKPEMPILSPSAPAGTSKDVPAHHAGPSSSTARNTAQNNSNPVIVKSEQETERAVPIQRPPSAPPSDNSNEKGKAVLTADTTGVNNDPLKKPPTNNNTAAASTSCTGAAPPVARKYNGPIFDFPSFTRKNDAVGTGNYNSNLALKYDVKDLLGEEGPVILRKRRADNLKKISGLLAINLERKRIRPDLVLKLQIEEKKLKLLELQSRVRCEVDQEQQEIMQMPDRPYRKFVRQCERQRTDLLKQVQQMQRAGREKFLKSVFQWRKKFLEGHWSVRDGRTTRNRGIAKYHERMLKDFAKRKDDDRNKRMEALKNNDVDRYRQMLLEQQLSVPGDAAQRYNVLSSFLSQTEEYLLKLGGKITSAKNTQEVEEAAAAAASAARAQGLSEEEVRTAAACAREEVMIRNRFSEMNAPREAGTGGSSANKYYNLAHAVNERVFRQPSMLRAGTLRDYQLVGLQWMLSLYNNKLNGILADEMGLGKTVQVMALIAFLMEFKGNYGPHLIIVPNAVLVNWKSELLNWLPSVSCIFYVGTKDTRAKLFSQEVLAMKFNVLVTTYEFVMYDRSKLSKVDWKYIIIDEAQRMKDRESVLARDLDRYRCQRRLLLTGTPLQNDLKELWSLLNLLLPEVFDNKRAFQEWFSKPFQRDGGPSNPEEDDWLETEKKVIIIHRLHQILEPFMLRRRVEDVEGSLPRKESIVLRCKMSAMQSAVYNWIKSTGTIRVDPEDEARKMQKSPLYQPKAYKNLNNKCMELRKVCNHPLLSYPTIAYFTKDFVVRSCGKLWVLDRILIKLHQAGHRVLLFSTMTKLLDIMEEYLQWRRLVYRRIDGTTSLEDRESAIVDFNAPNSDCFIFLLSIRAAGRGLNLQSADTVVIYDPDPNPQNEEQAVARAHRIGQTREVKVIYLEAVVDKVSSYQKEDDSRQGGSGADFEDDLIGKDRYMASIESLIRSNIQQYKIDMADEVINAGRFDQRTTHEERRMTLETLLHDDERNQETVHDVPSLQEVNRMIARSEEEVEMFDQMDEEFDWPGDMVRHNQVPKWLRTSTDEVDSVVTSLSKKKKGLLSTKVDMMNNSVEESSGRRARVPKSQNPKYSIYREIDSDEDESEDEEEEEGIPSNAQEEGEESGESEEEEQEKEAKEEEEEEEDEEEEYNGVKDATPGDKDNEEEEEEEEEGGPASNANGEYFYEDQKDNNINDERYEEEETNNGSGSSSGGNRRLPLPATPSESSQKFASLSALEAFTKRTSDDLEDGEIALSGDSRTEVRQTNENYEEQMHLPLQLQQDESQQDEPQHIPAPKIKRKRSMRIPRFNTNINFDNNNSDNSILRFNAQPKEEPVSAGKQKRSAVQQTKKSLGSNINNTTPKSGRLSNLSGSGDSKAGWSGKSGAGSGSGSGSRLRAAKMSEITQRKCKNVISKLWKRIDRDGHQIMPLLSDWWRRNVKSTFMVSGKTIHDLRRIEQRVDTFEYGNVSDFIKDLQLMLKNVVRYHNNNYSLWQIRNEAERFHSLFFEIMKIAFPDSDFREAKNSIDFSTLSSTTATTPNSTQSKRQSTPLKSDSDRPISNKSHGSGSGSKSQRDPAPHPGDLVVCKKKRKDREKPSLLKFPVGSSPSSSSRIGPLNPGKLGPISPAGTSSGKGTRTPFQRDSHNLGWGQGSSSNGENVGVGIGDVQWAKPVKRMRSDTGKRRPSHL